MVAVQLAAVSAGTAVASASLVILPVYGSYSDLVLSDSPIAYWRLEEATGNAADETGHGHTATAVGGPTSQAGLLGLGGKARVFNGTSQYFTQSDAVLTGLHGAWTVEAIVAPNASANGSAILSANFDGGNVGFALLQADNNGAFGVGYYNGSWHEIFDPAATYTPGKARHVVGTFDGSTLRLFIDKVQVASQGGLSGNNGSTGNMYIGRRWDTAGARPYFIGAIDEAAIYGYALPESRVGVHYDAAITNRSDGVATALAITSLIGLSGSSAGVATVAPSVDTFRTATFSSLGDSYATSNVTFLIRGIPTRVKKARELAREKAGQGSDLP